MENASKALIMVAEILLGVIFIALLVIAYYNLNNFADSINYNIQNKNINEFNSQFTVYERRKNLTVHDIVTIVNLVNEHNLNNADEEYQIKITGNAIKNIETIIKNTPTFISDNQDKEYTVNKITFNDRTKLVKTINITVSK